jgi:pimeloyl-ACP methyl ester carboxylesterase
MRLTGGNPVSLTPWLLLLPALLLGISLAAASAGFVVQAVERQQRFAWTADDLSTVAREAVSRFVFSLARPFVRGTPKAPRKGDGIPVLLVPSPQFGRVTLSLLHTFLRQRGLRVWPLELPRVDHSLAQHAELIERAVAHLRERTGSEQVDVVAHGLGGLAAAWAVRHGDADAHVRRLVTLGTPWHGTRMAVFLPEPVSDEVQPDTHHLDELTPPSVPTVSIWCPDDPVVIPATSAVADVDQCVAIERAGHLGLLVSARAMRAVHTALTDPLFGGEA